MTTSGTRTRSALTHLTMLSLHGCNSRSRAAALNDSPSLYAPSYATQQRKWLSISAGRRDIRSVGEDVIISAGRAQGFVRKRASQIGSDGGHTRIESKAIGTTRDCRGWV